MTIEDQIDCMQKKIARLDKSLIDNDRRLSVVHDEVDELLYEKKVLEYESNRLDEEIAELSEKIQNLKKEVT